MKTIIDRGWDYLIVGGTCLLIGVVMGMWAAGSAVAEPLATATATRSPVVTVTAAPTSTASPSPTALAASRTPSPIPSTTRVFETPTPEALTCTGRVLAEGLNVRPAPGVTTGVLFSVEQGVTFMVWGRVERDGYEWLDVTIQDGVHAVQHGWLAAETMDGSRRFVSTAGACE